MVKINDILDNILKIVIIEIVAVFELIKGDWYYL